MIAITIHHCFKRFNVDGQAPQNQWGGWKNALNKEQSNFSNQQRNSICNGGYSIECIFIGSEFLSYLVFVMSKIRLSSSEL